MNIILTYASGSYECIQNESGTSEKVCNKIIISLFFLHNLVITALISCGALSILTFFNSKPEIHE
jgi:hypothetical protein